ncbi:MAG: endo alpha-1,4 polygalactosaminidase [Patescibacteria group bacterium]
MSNKSETSLQSDRPTTDRKTFLRRLWLGGLSIVVILMIALGAIVTLKQRLPAPEPISQYEPSNFVGSFETRADGAWRLTSGTGSASFQNACFSPDSQQLVYTRWRDGYNQGPADLVARNLASGEERLLVGDGDSANVNVPFGCWRGASITFASDRGGRDEIWIMATDGTNLRQVTHHNSNEAYIEPVFSPDGSKIAFEIDQPSASDEDQFGQIFVIDRDGQRQTKITGSTETDDRLPSWASDGRILFQRRTRVVNEWSDWDVFAVESPDGLKWSAPVNLTDQSANEETDNSWDPSAQFIVSSSDYGGLSQPNIFAFRASGGEPIRLTTSSDREDGAPSISPDGRWLVFESHRTADEASPSDLWLKEVTLSPLPSSATSRPVSSSPAAKDLSRWWQPTPGLSFQWQLTKLPIDTSVAADVYEIDGLDNGKEIVDNLHAQGRRVICYVDVGSWENYRDDASQFPADVLGNVYQGWSDERWLDIRQIDQLAPILSQRFDTCRDKGFDAVEADNVDGFEQTTGFPITADDQLQFNRWVAAQVHQRGMAVALKNDGAQAAELVNDFDFVVTEECVLQNNCDEYALFRAAGKLHLNAEYTDTPITVEQMCAVAKQQGFTTVLKQRDLDINRKTCQ